MREYEQSFCYRCRRSFDGDNCPDCTGPDPDDERDTHLEREDAP